MKKDLKEMAKKLERYQTYFDERGKEILKLRKENGQLKTALSRLGEDKTATWEQTEMPSIIEKVSGKTIKMITPINDEKNELWQLKFIFTDETEFNVYMCQNAGYYLDFDLIENNNLNTSEDNYVEFVNTMQKKSSDELIEELKKRKS